ncbi:TPA: cell division protein FtsH, partial [Candidatus Woesearchaeota archaeon]|nr:cell division protein FtsH [Candidatus Woesearchaeota archaeon]
MIIFFVVSAYSLINENKAKEDISISELAMAVKFGEVKEISVKSGDIEAIFQNDVIKTSKKEESSNITETLAAYGITSSELANIKISVTQDSGFFYWLLNLSPILFPVLFIAVFIWLMTRQMKGSGMQAFSFGQSKARITDPNDKNNKVTFKDVAGCKE